ncbi:MAG: hypothetical protein ACK5ZC_11435 [Pirellulaceae bacterium]
MSWVIMTANLFPGVVTILRSHDSKMVDRSIWPKFPHLRLKAMATLVLPLDFLLSRDYP